MKSGSLQIRLLLAAGVAIAAALFLAGLALTTLFEQQVRNRVMQELNNDLLQLVGAVEVSATGDVKVTRSLADPRYETPYGNKYWRIERVPPSISNEIIRSRSYWDSESQPANDNVGPEGEALISAEREITVKAADKDMTLRLVVSTHDEEITSPLSQFRNQITLYLSLIGLALTLAAWVQVSIGLKPLQTLRGQLAKLGTSQTKRLTGEFPTEVQPLVSELNEVLDLRETSLASQFFRQLPVRSPRRAMKLMSRLKKCAAILNGALRAPDFQRAAAMILQTLLKPSRQCLPRCANCRRARSLIGKIMCQQKRLFPWNGAIFWNFSVIYSTTPENMHLKPYGSDLLKAASLLRTMVRG
jgi:HAMP domain-containing protein